jgi:hypothetical protein
MKPGRVVKARDLVSTVTVQFWALHFEVYLTAAH